MAVLLLRSKSAGPPENWAKNDAKMEDMRGRNSWMYARLILFRSNQVCRTSRVNLPKRRIGIEIEPNDSKVAYTQENLAGEIFEFERLVGEYGQWS
jgi:hypothetical protein